MHDAQKRSPALQKAIRDFRKQLIATVTAAVIALVVIFFPSKAWFAANRRVAAGNAGTNALSFPFELACATVEDENQSVHMWEDIPNGVSEDAEAVYAGSYSGGTYSKGALLTSVPALRSTKGSSAIRWWMDGTVSDFEDLKTSEQLIEPGCAGKLTFYIVMTKVSSVASCRLALTGYEQDTESAEAVTDGTVSVPVTAVTDEDVIAFLSGHVLLFADFDPDTGVYRGWLPDGRFSVDISQLRPGEAMEVSVYWVWPAYFDQLTTAGNPLHPLLCDPDGADYALLSADIRSHPDHYFSSTGNDLTIHAGTADDLENARIAYNAADSDIGNTVHFLEAMLAVE